MNEKSFDFNKELEKSLQNIKEPQPGNLIDGKVVSIFQNEVFVDIGWVSEILIAIEEFTSPPKVFDDVLILCYKDKDDFIHYSKKRADEISMMNELTEAFEKRYPVSGIVTELSKDKKSVYIDIQGIRALCYINDLDNKDESLIDPQIFIKNKYQFIIKKIQGKKITLSHKLYLENQVRIERIKFFKDSKKGDILEGIVKRIIDKKGAEIDLGGFTGFLPQSEVSYSRYSDFETMISAGDHLKLKIIELDKRENKIILSFKQMNPHPWETMNFAVNDVVKGTIRKIFVDGVIIEIENGIDGFIHKSDYSWFEHEENSYKKAKEGEIVEAKILGIDINKRKIKLGIKQILPNPWDSVDEKYRPGQSITGIIKRITEFGIFIELEKGVDGLLHKSELSWMKEINPMEVYKDKINQEIKVVIKEISRQKKKIALSLRALFDNPWDNIKANYPINSTVEVVLSEVYEKKLIAKIAEDIEAIIPISEVSTERIHSLIDKYKIGDTIIAKVKSLDIRKASIVLSIKELLMETQEKDMADFLYHEKEDKVSLSDLMKNK